MQIKGEHILLIKESLQKVKTKRDLTDLFRLGENLLFGEQKPKITLKKLTFFANPHLARKRYHQFTIKKKSGKDRIIHAPNKELKYILRVLNFIIQAVSTPHPAATGFVLGKSVVDNARKHVGKRYVYNIDLKDFFHSFDRQQVKRIFMREPFNLNGEKEPLAFMLSGLTTHLFNLEGKTRCVLPQGAPTSPTLTNLLSRKLDRRLNGLAKRFGLTYTRYADDITFSSNHNVFKKKEFTDELERIITELGLQINPEKTRLQYMTYRQETTGLTVNEKVNVKRRYIKQIRHWLYFWERYGYKKAQKLFLKNYIDNKGHVKPNEPELKQVLEGKLLYLKMVKGINDSTYKKLQFRFNRLILGIEVKELEFKGKKYYYFKNVDKFYDEEGKEVDKTTKAFLSHIYINTVLVKRKKEKNKPKEDWSACVIGEVERKYNNRIFKSYYLEGAFLGSFWLNEMDFIGYEHLYEEEDENNCPFYQNFQKLFVLQGAKSLKLKGPFDQYFIFIHNKNGQKIIMPKDKIAIKRLELIGYEAKKSRRKKSNKILDNQNLPSFEKKKEEDFASKLNQMDILSSEHLSTGERKKIIHVLKDDLTRLKNQKVPEKKGKIITHDPIKTIDFLNKFSEDETLKYLVHQWDSEESFNYNDFIQEVTNKLKDLSKEFLINENTWRIVNNFAIGQYKGKKFKFWKDLYDKEIHFGWENVKDWSIENERHPYDIKGSYNIPEQFRKNLPPDIDIKDFKDLIIRFKNTIRFTADADYTLYDFLRESFKLNEITRRRKYNINFNDIKDKSPSLHIDKNALYKAIRRISQWIIKHSENNKEIKLLYEENSDSILLHIIHVNSSLNMDHDNKKFKEPSGDLAGLLRELSHICDFSLKAIFNDGAYELPLLVKGETQFIESISRKIKRLPEPKKIEENDIEGFTYIFKFYKTK